jgi:SAM-dependent methyltransferase
MKCIACDFSIKDLPLRKYLYKDKEFSLFHCKNCKIEFWWPTILEKNFYQSECDLYESYHAGRIDIPYWYQPFFKEINKISPSGKVLDIGCGDGLFLSLLKKYPNLELYGIDLDEKSIKIAQTKHNLANIFPLSLKEFYNLAKEKNIKFEIITAFEVLEHQDKPKEFLNIVFNLLAPHGLFIGTVPNRDRVFADVDRKLAYGDFPPHHFLWFNKTSLEFILQANGFKILKIKPFSNAKIIDLIRFLFFSIYPLHKKIKINLKRKEPAFLNILFSILKFLRNTLLFLPAILILPFYRLKGEKIFFIAQKPLHVK